MRMASEQTGWVALQVRLKTERTVAMHLDYRGYEYFLPLGREAAAGNCETIGRPLFPGYVFCRFQTTASAPIVTTPGVCRIVSFGAGPAFVADDEIESVRRTVESGLPVAPIGSFQPGTKVLIANGPLQGVRGSVLDASDRQFLVVSIGLLRRSIAVEMDPRWVQLDTPHISGRVIVQSATGAGTAMWSRCITS